MPNLLPKKHLSNLLDEAPDGVHVWGVDVPSQQLYRHRSQGVWERTDISTSRFGIGSEPDSNRTPAGWHRVTERFGEQGPIHQEFISRKPVAPSDRDDRILSRILWLDGVEPDLNTTSHDRYIYIHGTNQTDDLGTPASMGCVRMHPQTIADWSDALGDEELWVWVGTFQK